jgi:2-polyprenyl-3-methyl-5-hydroxy-6-metoxy-1,4-benzoquinol methylase
MISFLLKLRTKKKVLDERAGNDKTWGDVYSKPASKFFFFWDILVHLRYLFIILLRRPKRAIEVGVGRGVQSVFLSIFIKDVVAVDSSREVAMNAWSTITNSKAKARLVLTDAFSMPFQDGSFDVCYSQGFLEHFSDEQIARLFKEQLRVAHYLVHSVPSDRYPWKQFGDERHLTPHAWHNILAASLTEANVIIRVRYGYVPLINLFIIIEAKPRYRKAASRTLSSPE